MNSNRYYITIRPETSVRFTLNVCFQLKVRSVGFVTIRGLEYYRERELGEFDPETNRLQNNSDVCALNVTSRTE